MGSGPRLLKQWRFSRGYSQAKAALELEVSQAAYSDWETAKKTPRLVGLLKIAAVTGIGVAEFAANRAGERSATPRSADAQGRERPSEASPPPSSRHPKARIKASRPAKARPLRGKRAA